MKKISLLFVSAMVLFAFNVGTTYNCKTLGLSFKKNAQTYNIPDNNQTDGNLKKSLKELYSVKIKPLKDTLNIYVGDKNDTLNYFKTLKHNIKLYKTKQSDIFILVDENVSQIGLSIPSQQMIIYYQCK